MIQTKLLTTSSVLLGVLASAAHAQTSTTQDIAKILFLGKAEPTVTVTGAVLEALPTRTVYYVGCEPASDVLGGSMTDPCPIMGGSVTQMATRWEYDVAKSTIDVSVWNPGNGTKTTTSVEERTTGTILCDVTSNTASCTGTLTYRYTTDGTEDTFGRNFVTTEIWDVSKSLEPVVITKGYSLIETTSTTTSTTSRSTGAAVAMATQPAGGLLLGVAGAAAVVGGAILL